MVDKVLVAGSDTVSFVPNLLNKDLDLEKKDVRGFIKSLMYNKNLFLFYPYMFYKVKNSKITMEGLCELFYRDFQNALNLRREKFPNYDTYFATIYERRLMIAKHEKNNLIFIENIELNRSETFNRIKSYYDLNPSLKKYL